ncbi:MAG: CRTAC1 family protein, partial [Bacteroidota bacterium]
ADADHPARLFVADFDDNGTREKILTVHRADEDWPLAMKRNLTAELTSLKKNSLRHAEYAEKSMRDLFSREALAAAQVWEATYFRSAVAINDGSGRFTLQALPPEVQFSCVCGIACPDLNADGAPDLVLAGNYSGFLPQFGRLDASYGHTLLNDGTGDFTRVPNQESGFFVRGDVKDLTRLTLNGQEFLLATVNNAAPRVFALKTSDSK